MSVKREETPFLRSDPVVILAAMDGLRVAGKGWINLSPILDDPPPPTAPLGRLFSKRGPAVPHATWTAPKGSGPIIVGIEHGLGAKAIPELTRCGVVLPTGARVRQDHPRSGLVVEVPNAVDDATIVAWLLDAAHGLSRVQLDDRWVAAIYPG